MSRGTMIGFDRKIEYPWIEAAAGLVAQGLDLPEIQSRLLGQLSQLAYKDEASGSARAKTVRVILRIWGRPADSLVLMHDRAIALFPSLLPNDRRALHWSMTIAAYPYFFDHAAAVGTLLSLQEVVTAPQVVRRIASNWGERETVLRTSRYVLRTMVSWGVLADVGKGTYQSAPDPRPLPWPLAELLIEAVLRNSSNSLPFSHLVSHPALFPFTLAITVGDARKSQRFSVVRQGMDVDIITMGS